MDLKKNDKNWRKKLTPQQYHILREKGTEVPFSGEYVKFDQKGKFVCAACGNELFSSETKFEAHCGWPSFYEAKKNAVEFKEDFGHGMKRIEVICKKCGGHLGHIFDDGPEPTGKRYCINSLALSFKSHKSAGKRFTTP